MLPAALPSTMLWLASLAAAGDATNELYAAPRDPPSQGEWLAELRKTRELIKRDINYTGRIYNDAAVNWTRLSVVQPQTHLYDLYLYDPVEHRYTVDRYLQDVARRYGGIDSILLWPTYPNIGIDARNQFDYFRALPGGLEGLTRLTAEFKARGVRVLWAYNPWDQGTRDEGSTQWEALARLLKLTGGDGFNGDTMTTMYRQFWDAGVTDEYHIVGEMEGGGYPAAGRPARPEDGSFKSTEWSAMGWGYFRNPTSKDNITYEYEVAPGVDKLKWLDGRRMTHVCDRWAKNRTDSLQYAFFNGVGYESWENVWGIFMHFTPRDGEALRRIATLLRWLGREGFVQDFADWEPYTPDLRRDPLVPFAAGGPVASKFQHKQGDCLWLIVNRAVLQSEAALDTSACSADGELRLYDLYGGRALAPPAGGPTRLSLEAHGFGAVLASSRALPSLAPLLARMRGLTARPLASYSAQWRPLQQEMAAAPGPTAARPAAAVPPGMVLIPKTRYRFRAAGVEIEGGCDAARDRWGVCCRHPIDGPDAPSCPRDAVCKTPCAFKSDDSRGVDVQFPWERAPGRFHDRSLELGPFYLDRHLVTKLEYAQYLNATGYRPRDPYNFLVGWQRRGADGAPAPAAGEGRQPVVWVSLAEARSYCAWVGKRLPHAYEWQLAAQGTDGRRYPWGSDAAQRSSSNAPRYPATSSGREVPRLPDVGSFSPAADSPAGIADLVGVVWQYTDEFRDEHTRAVLLKGSSVYAPMISSAFPALPQVGNWYFPRAPEVDRHGKMFLMDDSYERAATLGFRCASEHPEGQPAPYHFTDLGDAADVSELISVLIS